MQEVTGWLPYLDYGARMYDPRIGRWFGADPLAEEDYSTSPYAFCGNNPINRVDLDGLKGYMLIDGRLSDYYDPHGIYKDIDILFVGHTSPIGGAIHDATYILNTISTITVGGGGFGGGGNAGFGGGSGNGRGGNGGGGGNGGRGSGNGGGGDPQNRAEALEDINDIVKKANDVLTILNEATRSRIFSQLGNLSAFTGVTTVGVDGYIAYDQYNNGEAYGRRTAAAGVGVIGLLGPVGFYASVSLAAYIDAYFYFQQLVQQINENGSDWFMGKIVPGYRP